MLANAKPQMHNLMTELTSDVPAQVYLTQWLPRHMRYLLRGPCWCWLPRCRHLPIKPCSSLVLLSVARLLLLSLASVCPVVLSASNPILLNPSKMS